MTSYQENFTAWRLQNDTVPPASVLGFLITNVITHPRVNFTVSFSDIFVLLIETTVV
jgi:hypothetical protein